MFNMHTVLTSERCLPVRPCGCCDVSLRLFWQFLCVFPLSVYQSISSVWRKFSVPPFSCFLLPSILSCLSQSAELQTKIVSLRAWLCSVCVFMCIHKGTTGCISKVMVTYPYLFVSSRSVCVFCYLGKTWMDTSERRGLAAEVWRSLSPLSLRHIPPPQKQKYRFMKAVKQIFSVLWFVLHVRLLSFYC